MSEEKFLQLNIAFRIPEKVAKVAMDLSREIAEKEDAYFVLDGVEYFPHATNYMLVLPEKNLDKMIKSIKELCEETEAIEFTFIENIAEQGWVGVHFDCSPQIKEIHSAFIEKINVFRENKIREKFKTSANFPSIEEQANIVKYGHPWILNLYRPHLTITRLNDEKVAERIADEMLWNVDKFKVDTIGVFISGEHGTCRKLLKEFKFGK